MEVATEFCLKYSWVFDCKMTEVFLTKPWQKAPDGWTDALCEMSFSDLKDLVSGHPHDDWPDTLMDFCITVVDNRKRFTQQWNHSITLCSKLKIGMNEKKQHEVRRMTSLIQELSNEHQCSLVADIGSGLGYLGQALTSNCLIDVLGFELREGSCQSVRKTPSGSLCSSTTQLLRVDSSPECTETLQKAFKQHYSSAKVTSSLNLSDSADPNNHRICLVGLHCCGDLTPATLHQFDSMDECKVLVCMGCCYHRLSSKGGAEYNNFPMSSRLRKVYENLVKYYGCSINTLALRLACQETKSRWLSKTDKEIEEHSCHVLYRGVLEHYCHVTGSKLSKKHKKLVGLSAFSTFDAYADSLLQRVDGLADVELTSVKDGLNASFEECKKYFPYIRWYNALQVMLQEVLETIILLDRQGYLTERGHECHLVSVFDDKISPRSVAIIAHKTTPSVGV